MRGVHAAIVTRFGDHSEIDHAAITNQINRLLDDGIHGIVVAGTMGEAGSLDRAERAALVATAVAAAGGRAPVCAGISAGTAEQAVQYASDAARAGVDSLMALPPLLYRGDRRELIEFFASITRAVDLPLMIYNNPMASGTDMTPELLVEIAGEVGAVSAFKETSGDARRIAELVNLAPEIDVMVGGDDWALEGFCAGASGWISGVAVVLPRECVALWDACEAGELATARELNARLLPLARLDMTPKLVQYFKAALDELGLDGGPCRPPRLTLSDAELIALREAVAHATAHPREAVG